MDDIICKKVTSMLSLYIDDRLNEEHKSFVEDHFKICPSCYQKYKEIKSIIENLRLSYEKVLKQAEKIENANLFNIREYEKFYYNISSYIDNELSDEESINFRKYLLKSKSARNDLKNAYNLKIQIDDSVDKCKEQMNVDLSKKISKIVREEKEKEFTNTKMYLKVAILTGLLIFSLSGMCLFFQSSKQPNNQKFFRYHKKVIYVQKPQDATTFQRFVSVFLDN